MQALPHIDFPFVFGGDGATLCVPSTCADLINTELASLISFAKEKFQLDLRVGRVPAGDIYAAGKDLLIAKLEITSGRYISLFRGGGLEYAEKLTKQEHAKYGISPRGGIVEELKGLSCRWSPVPASKGTIVSLLVVARGPDGFNVYRLVLDKIRQILNCRIEEANPVTLKYGQYKKFWQALCEEYKYHRSMMSSAFFKRLIDIALSVLIFRYRLNPVSFNFDDKRYSSSIAAHSDYRKFDDTLRLVIDCHDSEYKELQKELDEAYREGLIYYGLFASTSALMTCFVESTHQGGHLHFIDGGDGGLTMAARQLKSQIIQ